MAETGRHSGETEIEVTDAMMEVGMRWACGVFGQTRDSFARDWVRDMYREMRLLELAHDKLRS